MDRITAVYDGKALVLQQPVDWPEGTVVEVKPSEPSVQIDRMTPDEAGSGWSAILGGEAEWSSTGATSIREREGSSRHEHPHRPS